MITAFVFTLTLNAQSVTNVSYSENYSIRKDKSPKKLSKFELQINRGSFILPHASFNFYLTDKAILRLTNPEITRSNILDIVSGDKYEMDVFLEFRKPITKKLFLSHGPQVGITNERLEDFDGETFRENEYRVGYNFGGGVKVGKHITFGTYVSPHVSIINNNIDFARGGTFGGSFANLYAAYRF